MSAKFFILIKWWRNSILLLCLLSLSAFTAFAQINQSKRYELLLNENEPDFYITTTQHGLFLSRHLSGFDTSRLELIRLDTSFNEAWKGFISLEPNHSLAGKRTYNNFAFFLFRHVNPAIKDLILFMVDEQKGSYTRYNIKSYIPFMVTELQVVENTVLIGGYYNRVPLVLHFNRITFQSKVLPGLFNEEGELNHIKTYEDGTFDVLISAKNFTKQKTIWIRSYNPEGNLIAYYSIRPEGNKNLLFGRSVKTERHTQLIAGVYGLRYSEYSRGLFVSSVNASGYQRLKYYNFGDLENFFKYMKARRESRIKERIERRKVKGKMIRFNYRFLVHEVIEYQGQFILLGEAFYPKYKSLENSYGGFFRPYLNYAGLSTRDGRVFDGYWYTHAVIIAFNENGDLLWDNSFEINDVKTFTLEQFVKIEVKEDRIVLLYLYGNMLRTKIIQGNKVLEGKTADPIETWYSNDIVLLSKEKADQAKLEYWYDDFFYAYGVQNIVNGIDTPLTPKRRVFFINKISYQ